MSEFLQGKSRTSRCAELNRENENKKVTLMGWVQKRRNFGSLLFIDLRDISGIVQVVFNSEVNGELFEKANTLRNEYCICVEGEVKLRTQQNVNKNLKTGEIEIIATNLTILSSSDVLPFNLDATNLANENLRLKYRYLDLRRSYLANMLKMRHLITKTVREYLDENGFLEIETPMLGKSTPEGARDYLVPSRVNKNCFYALPQSPQIYKQLLMIAGMDRYYQIARCFRDEDLRANRQPEFTQIDLEMSFIDKEEQIMTLIEGLMVKVFKNCVNIDLKVPFKRLTYKTAMETYGSDKPDLRFGYEIQDYTSVFKNNESELFKGKTIRGIMLENLAKDFSRKELDKLTDVAKTYRAKGLITVINDENGLRGSAVKLLSESEIKALNLKENSILLLVADSNDEVVCTSLGAIRLSIADKYNLRDNNKYELAWVVDFPLLEYDEEEKRYVAKHHPFTSPKEEDLIYMETAPEKIRAKAYDLVINGEEAGGGSIRIYNRDLQKKMFNLLGFSEEDIEKQFGFFVNAFNYGTPPHGGLAFGLDRLVMLLAKTDNIKDVIAFPKIQTASCLMSNAPSLVSQKQLDELKLILDTSSDK